jgi:hypothetical protein
VIATGFGERELERHTARYSSSGTPVTTPVQAAPTRPIDSIQAQPSVMMAPPPPPPQNQIFNKPVRRLGMVVDDSTLDIPAFKRRSNENRGGPTRVDQNEMVENDDKLDIPAFLRKPLD